jgi:hypothetical protein
MTSDKIDKVAQQLEAKLEAAADALESGLVRWILNDRIFNGFRNSYARALLMAITIGLQVWGFVCSYFGTGWTAVILWIVGTMIMHASLRISVRDVFVLDAKYLDEFQLARRDRAYVWAFRVTSFSWLVAAAVLAHLGWFGQIWATGGAMWPIPEAAWSLQLTANQVVSLFLACVSVYTFAPHFAYGIKGEPFLTRAEQD